MNAERVLETCLYVDDLAAAEAFYTEVLGLEFFAREAGRHVFLRCGASMVLLFNPERVRAEGASDLPRHGSFGPGHLALAASAADLPAWRAHLAAHGVEIVREVTWPAGQSIYFCDPAGNSLELATPAIWGLA
jgi:catechol 2,3-dioxygenase-like lactoylglutathione lyase family enzyme